MHIPPRSKDSFTNFLHFKSTMVQFDEKYLLDVSPPCIATSIIIYFFSAYKSKLILSNSQKQPKRLEFWPKFDFNMANQSLSLCSFLGSLFMTFLSECDIMHSLCSIGYPNKSNRQKFEGSRDGFDLRLVSYQW